MTFPPPAPPPAPLWSVQLALEAILLSIEQYSSARLEWAASSSLTLGGIPSFGLDARTGGAVQPTRAQVAGVRLPIEGEAWDEYRDSVRHNAEALKGIRSFRSTVQREIDHVQRLRIENAVSSTTTSNAPFLCLFWQQVLQTSLTSGPVLELNASFAVPTAGDCDGSRSYKRRQKPNRRRKNPCRLAKVDIVGSGGRSWTRIITIKQSSLLAEFRVAESEMVLDSDHSGDESDTATASNSPSDMTGSDVVQDAAQRLDELSRALFAQLDPATASCSPVRALKDLLACRDAAQDAQQISVTFLLSRIPLPPPNDDPLGLSMAVMASLTEEDRYKRRLQTICNVLDRLPRVDFSSPSSDKGLLRAPPGKLLPYSLATGQAQTPLPEFQDVFDTRSLMLPAMPSPATDIDATAPFPVTQDLNLDVSALVALVSDVTHMEVPPGGTDLETMFRAGGLKSIAEQDRAAARGALPQPAASVAAAAAAAQGESEESKEQFHHGRALAMQLRLEAAGGKSFLEYLARASRTDHGDRILRFWATAEAQEKFHEIMRLIGGPTERARARGLVEGDTQAFWQGSRYEHDSSVRNAFQLVVGTHDVDLDAMRRDGDSLSGPPSSFQQLMRDVLLDGLQDVEAEANGQSAHRSATNPRQTPHTLNSLLCGLMLGMTTLTTNMLSVRWMVKEYARRRANARMKQDTQHELDITDSMKSLEVRQQHEHALIYVTNPRSLAERMRVDAADFLRLGNRASLSSAPHADPWPPEAASTEAAATSHDA
ncbi:unnamed protein product [Parajaminaea phylloscopi]